MGRRGFISALNAVVQESARRQRLIEAEKRRQERVRIQNERETERDRRLKNKEEKQRYLEEKMEEAEDKNTELSERIKEFGSVLEHTLSIDDTIRFDALKIKDQFKPAPTPHELATPRKPPRKEDFFSKVKGPGFLERALGLKKRYEREVKAAESQFNAAKGAYGRSDKDREAKLAEFLANQEKARQAFMLKLQQRNQEVDELETSYRNGDPSVIITYNTMVLERSEYPEGFPQKFRLAYAAESKQLVIDYDLPGINVIPKETEYKYIKAKDLMETKPRKIGEIKELYQEIVSAVALRTLHEVFEADQGSHVEVAVFNGFVHAVDQSTGREIYPCLISARATRGEFVNINLARVDKKVCLRSLGAQVSSQPQALQPVKPIVEFDMIDKRFIEQTDILSELDSRPNLMDLTPTEFEGLVSNLFSKMGLETKLTRTSKDGGVDAVAFDIRPVLGGKVVIQAKRYKNTVGVSAVRDLYGTMLNEGANKGILVATSGYGPDAYEFSKDKPIELIDGGGLLYLLDQVGIKARIILPEDGA